MPDINTGVGVINRYVNSEEGSASRATDARRLVNQLNPAERRLLYLVVDGSSLIEASVALGMSLEEAARLRSSLMQKLGASRTADLVRVGLYASLSNQGW